MATTADLRNGAVIRYNGERCVVEEFMHRTPGNLRAFYQAKMRNLRNGKIVEARFRSGEELEFVRIEYKKMQYLYKDGENLVCMDTETYDQFYINENSFGEGAKFLKEGFEVNVGYEGDIVVIAEIPTFVELVITYTEPGMKGDTVNNVLKPATLETGAIINVPIFVNTDEKIKVDTRTSSYVERVK